LNIGGLPKDFTKVQEFPMFKFDKSDLQRIAVSSIGAAALSATCILGVSSPAHAARPSNVDDWRSVVERQLDGTEITTALHGQDVRQAVLAVRCDAAGRCGNAELARSSGDALIDQTALETARGIDYPALPVAYAGRPTTVSVRLFYGASASAVATARAHADTSDLHYATRDTRRGGGASQVIAK
jgi:TonB family protein